MLVFADLHLKESTEDVCFRVLEEVYRLAQKDDGRVVFCGDFWQLRYQVSVRLLNRVVEALSMWCQHDIRVDMVPGNHDQVTTAGDNALEVLGRLPGVRVWTESGFSQWEDKWLAFVPYRKDQADQAEQYGAAFDGAHIEPAYLFGHFGVQGATMNSGRADRESVSFGVGIPIILGHYHRPQTVKGSSVTYVGSPYQQSFGEAGNESRVLEITPTTIKSIPIDVGAPRHFIVEWDGEGKPPPRPEGFRDGDKLRVDLCAPAHRLTDKVVVKALRKELKDAMVNVIPEPEERSHRFVVPAGEALQDSALRFLGDRVREEISEDCVDAVEGQEQRFEELAVPLRRWGAEEVGQ
jgi:DNA repair exonuclease SbcCD nuclease subunit